MSQHPMPQLTLNDNPIHSVGLSACPGILFVHLDAIERRFISVYHQRDVVMYIQPWLLDAGPVVLESQESFV